MKRIALSAGFLGLVASAPAFSDFKIVSLHSGVVHNLPISWLDMDPGLALVGLLVLAGTIVYRFGRAK